ncbi:hypothetical protein IFM89_012090, partial [Coptis chinensis]
MAGSPNDDCGVGGSSNGISSGQRCQSGEALAEWRSSEQVENGTPSTSPPYWDTDEDDDDCGPKPSELYGKFTWRIEKFSQISKRELRSNAFEVGGYKWYILIYPQGCDVCNHLSLFLCVANHDKLLPGWSHFAQFTIAVVNKDPKKSKYSDTLHRFWKKEHDWGWKKFMELSKVQDGFITSDTLIIKAQVQVIREKSHRPFRCLDCQYRRELVRVYLTNVEQLCRRFVMERRDMLGKLIEDKVRWSSFRSFWSGVEPTLKRRMSREKTDIILKAVVKQFFVEKEVTSTLVMDSLYSGLKALECQSKSQKGGAKLLETEETPDPIVCVEKDMFVLADDVLKLLDRATLEPLPPKDEKGPQNRTKDGSSGEDFNKESIERDERRLTELGRRSVEIFVLSHIFSNKVEVAYQESVALKRQEELIREEEAAWQAESEQKARRGAEKEKRSKKKQGKQRKSSRKTNKGKDEKYDVVVGDRKQHGGTIDVGMLEKPEALDDVSDVSIAGDDIIEMLQPDVEDRDSSLVNSDTDTSEVHHIDTSEVQSATEAGSSGLSGIPLENGRSGTKTSSVMDDSSSTCSTDSVPSVATNGSFKGNSLTSYKSQKSPSRGKKQGGKDRYDQTGYVPDLDTRLSETVTDIGRLRDVSGTCRATEPESENGALSMNDQTQRLEHLIDEKVALLTLEEEIVPPQKKLSVSDPVIVEPSSKQTAEASSSPSSPRRNFPSIGLPKSMTQDAAPTEPFISEASSKRRQETISSPQVPLIAKVDARSPATSLKPTLMANEKPTAHQVSGMSRPSSTPLIPVPRPSAPVVSMVQTTPLLSRSVSAAGRLGVDSSAPTHSYAPSYRNAIMGKTLNPNPAGFTARPSGSSASPSQSYSHSLSTPLSSPMQSPQRSGGNDQSAVRPGFTFGSVTPEILHNRPQWLEYPQHDANMFRNPSELNGIHNLNSIFGATCSGSQTYFADELPSVAGSASTRQAQAVLPDEFPHLDIINYLLDEEQSIGKGSRAGTLLSSYNGHDHPRHHALNRQYTFPGEMAMSSDASPSINYSRYDQLDSYHDSGMHSLYGSSGSNYNGLRDAVPIVGQSAYGNGHIDGVTQNQWPFGGAPDISLLSLRNNDSDGYSLDEEHTKEQLSTLQDKVSDLKDQEYGIVGRDVDIGKGLQRLKELEEESSGLGMANSRLQGVNSELLRKLESTQVLATYVLELPEKWSLLLLNDLFFVIGVDLIPQGWSRRGPNVLQEGYGTAAVLPEQGIYLATSIYQPVLQNNIGIAALHMQLLNNNHVVIFDRTDFGLSNILLPNGKCRNDSNEK